MFEPGHAASDQSPTVAGNFRWPTRGLFGASPIQPSHRPPPLSLYFPLSLSAHRGASSSRWGEQMGKRGGKEGGGRESRGATMEGRWAANYEASAHQAQARQKNRKLTIELGFFFPFYFFLQLLFLRKGFFLDIQCKEKPIKLIFQAILRIWFSSQKTLSQKQKRGEIRNQKDCGISKSMESIREASAHQAWTITQPQKDCGVELLIPKKDL